MYALIAAAALITPAPAVAPHVAALRDDNPPIRIRLSDQNYETGDKAKVKVKTAKDGYLVVLREDADGHVRVVYPVNPNDESGIRGGHEYTLEGRGGRETFRVSEREGTGTVLGAWSATPFDFSAFTHNGRWDYRALAADSSSDPESALLEVVDQMTSGQYQYDVATYSVNQHPAPQYYAGVGPWYYGSYWPYWGWDPWYYGPRLGFGGTVFIGGHSHFDRDGRRFDRDGRVFRGGRRR
ncbi:MAG TPA: DUF4384 domain-containing protein [Gemmatimonadales bacterium]|nr:DUF4384 domain-containing protein [Gemmatimonadales bacterium]